MPQLTINNITMDIPILSITRVNFKIIHKRGRMFDVFNTHNENVKSFLTMRAAMHYYSPNSIFVDFDTSRKVDKVQSIEQNNIICDDIILYKGRFSFSLSATTFNYINTFQATELYRYYSYYLLPGGTFPNEIFNRIATRINGPRTTVENDRTVTIGDIRGAMASAAHGVYYEEASQAQEPNEIEINRNLIYGYHSGPREVNFLKTEDENTKRYFGIELEIEPTAYRGDNARHLLATKLHKLLNDNNYNQVVKFERDGSLSDGGIEIITQPMTMKWLLTNKEKFAQAMNIIDNERYGSHDTGKCGMHIHVSRNSLTPAMIDNLYLMFENFKNEIVAFSRRQERQMRWCSFICDNTRENQMTEEYIKNNKPCGNSHHSAINNGNSKTVEFRIFRGTTKLRTFIANVQLIDNMINLSTQENIEGITWENIINHNKDYIELKEYNEKRNIISKHELSKTISRMEVIQRPVILVRPFQMNLEGDN